MRKRDIPFYNPLRKGDPLEAPYHSVVAIDTGVMLPE